MIRAILANGHSRLALDFRELKSALLKQISFDWTKLKSSDPSAIASAAFGRAAVEYTEKYFSLTDYDSYLDRFLACLEPVNSSILDIACGPGNIADYLSRANSLFHVMGVDLAPEMIEIAKRKVPDAEFAVCDCRELQTLSRKFNGASFSFGLSYLTDNDANRFFSSLHSVLEPSSPLYLATVTGNPADSGFSDWNGREFFTAYRTVDDVLQMVSSAGFKILWSEVVSSPSNATFLTDDLILVAHL